MPTKIKKTLAILLSLCVISALAGCSENSPGTDNAQAQEKTALLSPEISPDAAGNAGTDSMPSVTAAPSEDDDGSGKGTETSPQAIERAAPSAVFRTEAPEEAEAGDFSDLKAMIDKQINADLKSIVWDIWVERLQDNESIHCSSFEDGVPMVSASLIKLFIMAAVYERVELGELEEAYIQSEMRSMITVSDNTAANKLTALLGGGDSDAGMDAVSAFADEIGCKDTKMNRLMLVDNGLQNYTTARDCAVILRMIYNGECVSQKYSEIMLELLKEQQRTGKIPSGVPEGVVTANKTGELTGISECDVAIVFAENADYIICVLSEPTDNADAVGKIIEFSKMTYSYLAK